MLFRILSAVIVVAVLVALAPVASACDNVAVGGAFSFTQAYSQPVFAQQSFVQSYSMPVQQVVVQRQFRQRVVQPVVVRRVYARPLVRVRAPFVSVGW